MDPAIEEQVEELRAQYEVSKNPCFAWHALVLLVQQPPPTILPTWLNGYMFEAGREVMNAVMSMKPGDFSSFLSEALGFTRQGASAVADWRELYRAEGIVGAYEMLKAQHALRRRSGGASVQYARLSPSAYAEERFAARWNVTSSQARRRISDARKFAEAVSSAQGKELDLDALRKRAEGFASFVGDFSEMIENGEATVRPDQTATERREERASARANGPPKSRTRKTMN
jgi:hypothetical protein